MKTFAVVLMLFAALRVSATTHVYGYIYDVFGVPITNAPVVFTPKWTPLDKGDGTGVVLGPTRKTFTSTAGKFEVDIMPGRYAVAFPGVAPDICMIVPYDFGYLPFLYCAQLCTNVPPIVLCPQPTGPKSLINAVNPFGLGNARMHRDSSTNNPVISLSR